jgi:diguanylate cyclase (GGDEF)-like protein
MRAADPLSFGLDDLPVPALAASLDGRVLAANDHLTEMLGWQQLPGHCREVFGPEGRNQIADQVTRAMAAIGRPDASRSPWLTTAVRADGEPVGVRVALRAKMGHGLLSPADGWLLMVLVARSEEERQAKLLAAAEQRFVHLAGQVPVGIVSGRNGLRADFVNERCSDILARPAGDLLGSGWLNAFAVADQEVVAEAAERVLFERIEVTVQVAVDGVDKRLVDVRLVPTGPDTNAGFVASVSDVTEALAVAEELARQARIDPLTGLPNRLAIEEHLDSLVDQARGSAAKPAVLFVDLDNFKDVNDSFGHGAGDELLRVAAGRLRGAVRPQDVVGRFGGDEFVVIIGRQTSPDSARALATRLLRILASPTRLNGQETALTASVGIVWTPRELEMEMLLRNADTAMYQAKRGGKNGFAFFDDLARLAAAERLSLQSALRRSLELVSYSGGDPLAGGFAVHYQPIVDTFGRPVAMEALCRWSHPQRGPVDPASFIAAAESAGVISAIDRLVHADALANLRRWRASTGCPDLGVAINASPYTLSDPTLADHLQELLSLTGVPGSAVTLEVTEHAVMEDPERVIATLRAVQGTGVKVAIDDFGTGHSSLAYLHELPVDSIKIDRSFVAALAHRGQPPAVITAVVSLARTLGLHVVAEGVETAEQREILADLGVDTLQGWLFARALAAPEANSWLREMSRTEPAPEDGSSSDAASDAGPVPVSSTSLAG